jgi:hypothetical protein
MDSPEGYLTPSGVLIAASLRSNLIIDRYDPIFADMRASKIKHLKSANSEDVGKSPSHTSHPETVKGIVSAQRGFG